MNFSVLFDSVMSFVLAFALPLFIIVLIFSAGMLWIIKPWRMTYAAAAVVNTPLAALYMFSFLFVLVPFMETSGKVEPVSEIFFHPVFIIMMVVLMAPIGYALLNMIDKDREKPPKNPLLHKVLNGVGIGFILAFFLRMGFGGFVNPMFIFEEFSLKFVYLFFVFIGTLMLFARFVLGGLVLALGVHDPYVLVIKPYVKWIDVGLVGSALIAFLFYLIDQLI